MKYAFSILVCLGLLLVAAGIKLAEQNHSNADLKALITHLQGKVDSLAMDKQIQDSLIQISYYEIIKINQQVASDTAAIGKLPLDSSVRLLRANIRFGLFQPSGDRGDQ